MLDSHGSHGSHGSHYDSHGSHYDSHGSHYDSHGSHYDSRGSHYDSRGSLARMLVKLETNPGGLDLGSSERELRDIERSSYRESTVLTVSLGLTLLLIRQL